MNLDTILRILYANNMTEVIVLATQIDNHVESPADKMAGQPINVRVSKDDLSKLGMKPKNSDTREHWFNIQLPILAVNQYSLKDKYLVEVLGKAKWVDGEEYSGGEVEHITDGTEAQLYPQENIA